MSSRLLASVVASVILSGLLFTRPASAQWPAVGSPQRPAWVDASVERRLRLLDALPAIKNKLRSQAASYFGSQGPGLAVGLVLDDGLFYSEGFGFADAQRTRKPDENTVFRAGSLSKVITGTALLTLADNGTLPKGLDGPAEDFLPELRFVCPNFNQPCQRGTKASGITLRHLVHHAAGLANVMQTNNAGQAAWLADLKKSWLLFKPGDYAAYSGVGAEAVGLIEERVSHEPYVTFVSKHLFAPLGMTSSSMDQTTLPQQLLAQKWTFIAGKASNPCRDGCNVAEERCMAGAHSSQERQACVRDKGSCEAACPPLKPTWWFTQADLRFTGDDQPMLAPAGGLATTVADLGRFITMWLSEKAPTVNGHALILSKTLNAASQSFFKSPTDYPLAACNTDMTDSNGFSYKNCTLAQKWGVNWWVGNTPFIEHSGSLGASGSETRIDQTHKMGATGLISTEPMPTSTPQPSGLDNNFIDTVVFGLLNAGKAADGPSWTVRALPIGVARVLYLSGKKPASGDIAAFTPAFVKANHLTAANIVSFLTAWQKALGPCSNFRVREVRSPYVIDIVLRCERSTWDTVLAVELNGPYRISWTGTPVKVGDNTAHEKCVASCNTDQAQCMLKAGSSDDRKACIREKTRCESDCK